MAEPNALRGFGGAGTSRALSLHRFTGAIFLFFAGSILAFLAFVNPWVAVWSASGTPAGVLVGWFVGSAEAETVTADLMQRGTSKAGRRQLLRNGAVVAPFLAIGMYLSAAWLTGQADPTVGLPLGGAAFIYATVAGSVHSLILQKALKVVEIQSGRAVWVVRNGLGLSYASR